jgi:ketosteroid isomerase-like protein
MSASAQAIVHRFFALAAARDFEAIPQLLDLEVVWHGTQGGLDEHRVGSGPDEFVAYMREIEEPWKRFDVAVEQVIEADDAVVALLHETAVPRGGDLEVKNDTAMVFRVCEGKIVEARGYVRRDEALAAVGLAP